VRLGWQTLGVLALCAASAAAALAHYAIDIVGDYALAHDTYDDVAHSSRELVSGIALLLALISASRGLRVCCDLAAYYRGRAQCAKHNRLETLAFFLTTIGAAACFVPAMECLDGGLAGMPVKEIDDAFGGSLALGLGVTIACALAVGFAIYSVARWLISHRDAIATIIETLLRRFSGESAPSGGSLYRYLFAPRRKRTLHAYRLCKRGPPHGGFVWSHHFYTPTEGDSRDFRICTRVVCAHCARDNAEYCRARECGAAAYGAAR
jgi:hypothetical protein